METLQQFVFSERRIMTYTVVANEISCNIDEANKLMYEFYLRFKDRLGSFFLIVRQDGSMRITFERIPDYQLTSLLKDNSFTESILNMKIWALYDKALGQVDQSQVYEAEEMNLHSIQNLCEKFRQIDLKKSEPTIKKLDVGVSQGMNRKTPGQNQTQGLQKSKTLEESSMSLEPAKPLAFGGVDQQQQLTQNNNKLGKSNSIKEEKQANTTSAKSNQKKRKGDAIDNNNEESQLGKELKKVKVTPQEQLFQQKPFAKTTGVSKDSAIEIEEEGETFYGHQISPQGSFQEAKEEELITIHLKSQAKKQSGIQQQHQADKMIEEKPVPTPIHSLERRNSQIQFNDDVIPDTEDTVKVRKTRKVPKDKTYMDSKGYLIVEKEFVDEEYWEVVKKKDYLRMHQPHPVHSGDSQNGGKKKPVEKNQATLGSFFKKK